MKNEIIINEFVIYTIVGISSSVLQYIVYSTVYKLTNNYVLGNNLAFIISVYNSFYWNRKIVFKNEDTTTWWKVLIKNYILYFSTGIILTNLLSYLMIDKWNIDPYLSPILIILILYPVNYILNKFWANKGETQT